MVKPTRLTGSLNRTLGPGHFPVRWHHPSRRIASRCSLRSLRSNVSRVPDAVQRSSRCSAEPGPTGTGPSWTPDQQRTASRCAASGARQTLILRMRSATLMVRSAATPRVSNHQAHWVPDCGSIQLENALAGHRPGTDIRSRAQVGIVSLPRASNTAHIRLTNGRFVMVHPLVSMNEARAGFEIS
jgi:hypothetical protein